MQPLYTHSQFHVMCIYIYILYVYCNGYPFDNFLVCLRMALRRWDADADADDNIQLVRYDASSSTSAGSDVEDELLGCKPLAMHPFT